MSQPVGLRTKLPMMLAALMFSLALYILVQSLQERAPRVLTVGVRPENLPDQYTITRMQDEIRVLVEGTDEELREVDPKRLLAAVDLREAAPGRNAYRPVLIGLPNQLNHELIPESIPIEIEPVLERELPVVVEPIGELAPETNLVYVGATVEPSRIRISGPESQVAAVQRIRALLDLGKIDSTNREVTSALEILGAENRPAPQSVEPSQYTVTIRPAVSAAPETKSVSVTAVVTGQPAVGYRVRSVTVKPDQVAIHGPSGAVAKVSTLSTRPISIEGIQGSRTFEVEVEKPGSLETVSPGRVRVEVIVEAQRGP